MIQGCTRSFASNCRHTSSLRNTTSTAHALYIKQIHGMTSIAESIAEMLAEDKAQQYISFTKAHTVN